MAYPQFDKNEFWYGKNGFWNGFAEDPDDIQDIQDLIFRDMGGKWWMAISSCGGKLMKIQVYNNPFTGEELR